jgi:hypothetical protein
VAVNEFQEEMAGTAERTIAERHIEGFGSKGASS